MPTNWTCWFSCSAISASMASSFETHRFAMLLKMRSRETHRFAMLLRMRSQALIGEVCQTLMVRSASSRVSNQEASAEALMVRVNRQAFWRTTNRRSIQPRVDGPIAAGFRGEPLVRARHV